MWNVSQNRMVSSLRRWGALVLFMLPVGLNAADIRITATVDRTRIGLNEQFQLTVEISGRDAMKVGEPKLPDLDTFAAYSGSSSSQSFQFINGRMQVSKSYTYYFIAARIGQFEIPAVEVEYEGKVFRSDPITIEIVKPASSPSPAPRTRRSQPPPRTNSMDSIQDNLFLKAEVNKRTVYQNEPIVVNYKIYTRVQVTDYRFANQPNYGSFWAEEFPIPTQPPIHEEIVNGRKFSVATVKKVALFPTSTGKKTIPPLNIEANVRVRERRRSRDFFDAFFDDPFFGRIITYSMSTDPLVVDVLPLPKEGRPADFSGAVGRYRLDVSVDRRQAKTNEAVTLKFTISGTGNIRIISPPNIQFPDEFEVYDPKISEKVERANDRIQGRKSFEYVMIPRRPGTFRITNLRYSYFDPEAKAYKVLSHAPIVLDIAPGDQPAAFSRSGLSREEVKLLSQDIRYIARNADGFQPLDRKFYHLPAFWAGLILPALVLVGGFVYRTHQDRLSSNVAYARNRRAQKLAQKQLREARKAMDEQDSAKFYAETSRALTSFVGNKLNLEESAMVSEEMIEQMRRKGVDQELLQTYQELLAECDFRRFGAAGASEETMKDAYARAKKLIAQLEKVL